MLKIVFWLLIAINVALFAANQSRSDTAKPPATTQESSPVEPEKLTVSSVAAVKAEEKREEQKAPDAPQAKATGCILIGPFTGAQAASFEKSAGLALNRLEKRQVATPTSFMVYVAAQNGEKSTEGIVSELKAKGITNFFVVRDGKFRNTVSLGIFRSEESARKHQASLEARGIAGTAIAGRGASAEDTAFTVSGIDAAEQEKIGVALKSFPHATQKSCQQEDFRQE